MMHLQKAIFRHWGADFVLSSLVPTERVLAGAPLNNPAPPYVVITVAATRPIARTSSGTLVDRVELHFDTWANRLEEVEEMAQQIVRRFERAAFDIESGRVLDMRSGPAQEKLHACGSWQHTLTFEVLLLAGR